MFNYDVTIAKYFTTLSTWRWLRGSSAVFYTPTLTVEMLIMVDMDNLIKVDPKYEIVNDEIWPDLSDPATRGCIRHLACELYRGDDEFCEFYFRNANPTGLRMDMSSSWYWEVRNQRSQTKGRGGSVTVPPDGDPLIWCLLDALEKKEKK